MDFSMILSVVVVCGVFFVLWCGILIFSIDVLNWVLVVFGRFYFYFVVLELLYFL